MKEKNSTTKNDHNSAKDLNVPTATLKGLGGGPDWKPRQAATQVAVGDIVRLRKPHPCGSYDWKVVRIGADIGLTCLGCEHRVLLSRPEFEKRFKNYLVRATPSDLATQSKTEAR